MCRWGPGEMFFAMECAGDVDTLEGRMNRFVNKYCESDRDAYKVAAECGLDIDALSEKEFKYLCDKVRKRKGD